jgi:hypothetical protein
MSVVGTCSKCGGDVVKTPTTRGVVTKCTKCGVVKQPKLPVIDMSESVTEQRQLLNE